MWKMSTSRMWSLGVFTPDFEEAFPKSMTNASKPWIMSHYRKAMLERQWVMWLRERVDQPVADPEMRDPGYNHQIATEEGSNDFDPVTVWHQDGCRDGRRCYLASWSNVLSTEVIDPETGQIYQAPPGEVYMWDNRKLKHRVPEGATHKHVASTRFFARGNYSIGATLNDHPEIYALTL